MAAMLLALLYHDDSMVGLTWMPFIGECYTAVVGRPMMKNLVPQSSPAPGEWSKVLVGAGKLKGDSRGWVPRRYRLAVVENLSRACLRLRTHGSTGTDLVYVANGILCEAVIIGCYFWYHAAVVVLVQAAGDVVTDLAGELWTPAAPCVVVAAPSLHSQILDILCGMGAPEDYRDVFG